MRRIKEKKAELQRIHEAKAKLSTRNPQHLRRARELQGKIDSIKSKDRHAKRTKRRLKQEYEALQREISNEETSPTSKGTLANVSIPSESSAPEPRLMNIEQPLALNEGPPRSQNEEDDDEEAFNQSPDQFGLHEQTVVVRQAEKLIKRRLTAAKDLERYEREVKKELETLEKDITENIRREKERALHTYEGAIKRLQTKSSRKIEQLSERLEGLEMLAYVADQRKQTDVTSCSKLQLSSKSLLLDFIAFAVSLLRNALFFTATIRDRFFNRPQQSQA
uniref:RAB6-interacting golgin n=1 Tax=Ascaris lumbricoides TaxID=6252 RepID=A0A0M3I340_ASCLU